MHKDLNQTFCMTFFTNKRNKSILDESFVSFQKKKKIIKQKLD